MLFDIYRMRQEVDPATGEMEITLLIRRPNDAREDIFLLPVPSDCASELLAFLMPQEVLPEQSDFGNTPTEKEEAPDRMPGLSQI